jgi:hypothetical protein
MTAVEIFEALNVRPRQNGAFLSHVIRKACRIDAANRVM